MSAAEARATANDASPDVTAVDNPPVGRFPWLLLAWGVVWAIIGVAVLQLVGPNPWLLEPSRADDMRASLAVLNHGGPLLLKYLPGTHRPYAVGFGDDQGLYVIVPLLSHWLGASDPVSVLRSLWIGAWAVTVLISPMVYGAIFRSRRAGLLAPPTLLVCILSFGFGDIYWVTAWVVVTFLPILLLIVRRRHKLWWLALIGIALVCSVVSAIRSEAGVTVAIAAIGVAATARMRWRSRATLVAGLVLAYISVNQFALPAIRAHRDHVVGVNLTKGTPTSHPLWHSVYIGLGYTANRYGIHYRDAYAIAEVHEVDPGAGFLSPAYSSALRKQVLALVKHDPGFVVKAELQKAVVELSNAGRYIVLLVLLLPAALVARGAARLRPGELALFAPAVLLGALPAIAVVPFRPYELTLFAPLGTLGLLAIGSAAAGVEQVWDGATVRGRLGDRIRATLQSVRSLWPVGVTARALVIAAVVLIPATLYGLHLENEHNQWDLSVQNNPHVVLAETAGRPAAN